MCSSLKFVVEVICIFDKINIIFSLEIICIIQISLPEAVEGPCSTLHSILGPKVYGPCPVRTNTQGLTIWLDLKILSGHMKLFSKHISCWRSLKRVNSVQILEWNCAVLTFDIQSTLVWYEFEYFNAHLKLNHRHFS